MFCIGTMHHYHSFLHNIAEDFIPEFFTFLFFSPPFSLKFVAGSNHRTQAAAGASRRRGVLCRSRAIRHLGLPPEEPRCIVFCGRLAPATQPRGDRERVESLRVREKEAADLQLQEGSI